MKWPRLQISLPSGKQREILLWIAIPLLSFLAFWFWRSNQWTGGDSAQWEREIAWGRWLLKRQMFSFAVMQLAFQITHGLWGWSARMAMGFVSCLAGAFSMVILWRMFRERSHACLSIAVVATAGFTTLFYGHMETYAQPVAALLFHLLAVQRTIEDRWRPWTIVATFGLVMAFHLVILFALPALAIVVAHQVRRRKSGRREYIYLGLAAIPSFVLWIAITRWGYGFGELVGPHFIHPLSDLLRRPWLVFTANRVPEKTMFMVWNGGLASVVAVWVFLRSLAPSRRDVMTLHLLAYFLCFLGFTLVWSPEAGYKDFDLFCFPWVIACVTVAHHIGALPARAVLAGFILGTNFYLWLTRPVLFSEIGHRGYGTIILESNVPLDTRIVLLDESFYVLPVNKYIPEGTHRVETWKPKERKITRIINVRPGETYWLRLEESGLYLEKTGSREKQ